jgi:hypothetical protein
LKQQKSDYFNRLLSAAGTADFFPLIGHSLQKGGFGFIFCDDGFLPACGVSCDRLSAGLYQISLYPHSTPGGK